FSVLTDLAQTIENARFQPGLRRRSATALISEPPILSSHLLRHQTRGFFELHFVIRTCRHSHRNAVRGVDELSRGLPWCRNLIEYFLNSIRAGFDESGMIVKHANLFHDGRTLANRFPGPCDIFSILPAAGIRAVSGSHKSQSALDAVGFHLLQSIRKHRMPVTIAPINRQMRTMLG